MRRREGERITRPLALLNSIDTEQWKKGETHQDGLKEKVLGKTTMEMGLKRRYWVVGLFVGLMGRDKKAKGTCHLAAVAFATLGQVDLTRSRT